MSEHYKPKNDSDKEKITKEDYVRLQEQIQQQQAHLNHLRWKESASI